MDVDKYLIWKHNKNEDITAKVKSIECDEGAQKYHVVYETNETKYKFNYSSLEYICNPQKHYLKDERITRNGREFSNIKEILIFKAGTKEYWRIFFKNGITNTYPKNELSIITNCLNESKSENCLRYLREIAAIHELKDNENEVLLKKLYENLDFVGADTTMAIYLNPKIHKIQTYNKRPLIFPFGGNASQFKAVENALCNQISVIQGPPGTGKTQTILNIIANLLLDNKTIQIASNNNSATINVFEKLSSYNLGFLVAALGNSENKANFIKNQKSQYPEITDWKMRPDEINKICSIISSLIFTLNNVFAKKERLAQIKLALSSLLLEIRYFEQYLNENNVTKNGEVATWQPKFSLNTETILKLWLECDEFLEKERAISLWFKIRNTFLYGISNWRLYRNELTNIINFLQYQFYQTRKKELESEISSIEEYLRRQNAEQMMSELTRLSFKYLRAQLFERYKEKINFKRPRFAEEDLRNNPQNIVNEYPIILSSTFMSRATLKGVKYDYLIIDEASQVDIATGALALSCAKNAVVVGDQKQLPNIVNKNMKKHSKEIFSTYNLAKGYSFSENSLLKSVCDILPDAPQTLLREHYRCHPKIIGFCNQKFYNNELILMKEDKGEKDAMKVFKTKPGNHCSGKKNERQIESIIKDALPILNENDPLKIAIIAPYNDQRDGIVSKPETNKIETGTVHAFQGREKDAIIFTTVKDKIDDFVDDPNLLNVAISRAIKQFILVVSGNELPANSNISDLIGYIEYHDFEIVESKIYSIFDMLYKQYTKARQEFLRKHKKISIYDSENIMYGNLVDILRRRPQLKLEIACHYHLNKLIKNTKQLNNSERRYAMNPATHVDFLIYSTMTKKLVLAIEVDGFSFHKPGTKQSELDKMKDNILNKYGIPILRFSTKGSGEIEKIERALDKYFGNNDN